MAREKLLAAAGTAAIIHRHDGVAVGREELPLGAEGMAVLTIRPAVNAEEKRHFGARDVAYRLGQQAVDFGAVLTLEADGLGGRDFQFVHQRVVLVSERVRE